MTIKSLAELEQQAIGQVLDASEVDIKFFPSKRKLTNKWVGRTNKHAFKPGDVYVLTDVDKEIMSFRGYINRTFNLTIQVYKKDGKAFCKVVEKRVKVNKPKRKRKSKLEKSSKDL